MTGHSSAGHLDNIILALFDHGPSQLVVTEYHRFHLRDRAGAHVAERIVVAGVALVAGATRCQRILALDDAGDDVALS